MAILNIQRRMHEVGRIRIGEQVKTASGKMAPSKLATFRFTSQSEDAIKAIADIYGGEVKPWKPDAKAAQQFEVVTPAKALDVTVAPGQVLSQFMEMWGRGKCVRRCDGEVEQLSGENCLCPFDDAQRRELAAQGRACKPTTRLSLMLQGVPVIGLWRIESHGFYAASELGGMAAILEYATAAGAYIPATLRLQERPGPKGRIYVPVLELKATIAEITAALSLPQLGTGGHEALLELPVKTSDVAAPAFDPETANSAEPVGYVDNQGRIHVPVEEPPLPGDEGHPGVVSAPIEFEEDDDVEDAVVIEDKKPEVVPAPVCDCLLLDGEADLAVDGTNCPIHAYKRIGRGYKPSAPAATKTATAPSTVQPEPEEVVAVEPAGAEMISPPLDGPAEAPGDGAFSQGIVIAAGKAQLDDDTRHAITLKITEGRTQSSKNVTAAESVALHNLFASIRMKKVALSFDPNGDVSWA